MFVYLFFSPDSDSYSATAVAMVTLLGAIGANFCFCFIFSSYIQGHQFHPDTEENNNGFCLELLADVTLFSTLITKKWCLLSGVYAGIIGLFFVF